MSTETTPISRPEGGSFDEWAQQIVDAIEQGHQVKRAWYLDPDDWGACPEIASPPSERHNRIKSGLLMGLIYGITEGVAS